jgi:TRAP-type C4-dicarboxylate transport system permease small subunit
MLPSMESIRKTLLFVSDKLKMAGAVFLVGMALLTCLDVIGRLFKYPIFGTVELVSFMGALALACSLPYTHQEDGHIGVELFTRKLPSKVRHILELCTELLSLALFILVSWRMFHFSISSKASGVLSMNLQLPEYAIIFLLACGFFIFTLTIINSIFQTLNKLRK